MTPPRKPGRQSKYNLATAELILERLAAGASLLETCNARDMPPESTVRGWVLDNIDGFAAKYARARDIGCDHENDAMIAVASDPDIDVHRARLIVDTMKWRLSKMVPKKYGDRISQEISGPDGAAIPTRVEVVFVDPPKRIVPGETKLIE